MKISGKTALVTGAARGIGARIVAQFVARGAKRIYGADVSPGKGEGVVETFALDVTDPKAVAAVARRCRDVEILVNNAGVISWQGLIAAPDLTAARREMEVNYWGMLNMCRAFAPVLKANGGGILVNVLSLVARVNVPAAGSYCATKAAAYSLTQDVRAELEAQGTRVIGVFPGLVETDMTKHITDQPKCQPDDVAIALADALEGDLDDVYVGDDARMVEEGMRRDPKEIEREFGKTLPPAAG